MGWRDYKSWSVFRPILIQAWKRKIELSYEAKFSVGIKDTMKGHRIMPFKLQTFLHIADLIKVFKREVAALSEHANNN